MKRFTWYTRFQAWWKAKGKEFGSGSEEDALTRYQYLCYGYWAGYQQAKKDLREQ